MLLPTWDLNTLVCLGTENMEVNSGVIGVVSFMKNKTSNQSRGDYHGSMDIDTVRRQLFFSKDTNFPRTSTEANLESLSKDFLLCI